MPGVGVAPGLNGFLRLAGSGIPGVGVAPFGSLFAFAGSGIPGVELPDGWIGVVESPSGRLFGSTFTAPTPAAFALALAFESTELQPENRTTKDKNKNKNFVIGTRTSSNLK